MKKKAKKQIERIRSYRGKARHGIFYTNTEPALDKLALTSQCLKKETEGMFMSAEG